MLLCSGEYKSYPRQHLAFYRIHNRQGLLEDLESNPGFTQPHTNTSGKNHSASKKTFVLKLTCFNVLQQVAHMAALRCFNFQLQRLCCKQNEEWRKCLAVSL